MRRHPIAICAAALAGAVASGCWHTPEPLPTREADRPLTLPARTVQLELGAGTTWSDPGPLSNLGVGLGLRYGITDRLSWLFPGVLSYALQRPEDRGAWDVALRTGLGALGYSPANGWLLGGVLGVGAKRRFLDQWWADGNLYIHRIVREDGWVGTPISGGAGVGRQLGDRWSLALGVSHDRFLDHAPRVGNSASLDLKWIALDTLDVRLRAGGGSGADLTAAHPFTHLVLAWRW